MDSPAPSFSEPLEAPTFGRAIGLWLATVGLGTLFIVLFFVFVDSSSGSGRSANSSDDMVVALIAGAMAALFSLPVLLILPFSLRWTLAGNTVGERYLRLLGLITSLFGLAAIICWLFMSGGGKDSSIAGVVAGFAAPYFVAALLAAYALYHRWLAASPFE